MASINKLSDKKVRGLIPTGKLYKRADGGGLFLVVTAAGTKTWRYEYIHFGKPQTLTIGRYPAVGLMAARAKRDQAVAAREKGFRPTANHIGARGVVSLLTAAETYWNGRNDISEGTRTNAINGIKRHLNDILARPVGSITRPDLMACLSKTAEDGKLVYVRKIRNWVAQVFEWAVQNDHAAHNPALEIMPRFAFARPVHNKRPALKPDQISDFLERLSMENQRLYSVRACRLLALTWARPGELRKMQWEHIKANIWAIPGKDMKQGVEHLIPLTPAALKIIEAMPTKDHSEYVFPAEHRMDRPMSENTISYLLNRMGFKGKMTPHGWRSVASTWANEQKIYRADVVEKQLAHEQANQVRAAYNRSEYWDERVAMMNDWADWLAEREPSSEAVTGSESVDGLDRAAA